MWARSISRETASIVPQVKSCQYCCDQIPREAKKCRACGEWVVSTSHGFGAAWLRTLGFLWALMSVGMAGGLWFVGRGVRRWVWMHSVNPEITPQVVDLTMYLLIAIVLIKGFAVSVGFGIMARLSPRRPRWWS